MYYMWRHISYAMARDVIQLAEEFISGHLEFFQNYPRIKIVFRLSFRVVCVFHKHEIFVLCVCEEEISPDILTYN